jgi:predicted methyltransferase
LSGAAEAETIAALRIAKRSTRLAWHLTPLSTTNKEGLSMRYRLASAAVALACLVGPALAQSPAPAASSNGVVAAVNDPGRPDKDTKQDTSRRPIDMVEFARVKPGETVVDVWPGGGYWTRIFSKVVGPNGKVYAYVPAEIAGFKSDPVAVAKAIASEPGHGNVEEVSDPIAAEPPADVQGTADVVWTFENYHDLHDSFVNGGKDVDAFNRAVFKVLKPGGYYVIVDHSAVAGSGLQHTEDLHRIDPAALRAEVLKAGFVYDGESKVLSNPDDPKTAKVFDDSIRGKTDRFAFRFRKPVS